MELRTELGGDPTQVAHARHLVGARLADWQVDPATGELTVLLVSELVTNALLHGRPPIHLTAMTTRSGVRVEVFDGNAHALPVVQDMHTDLPGGRGMQLVEALADRWGSAQASDGKCVWFEVDLR